MASNHPQPSTSALVDGADLSALAAALEEDDEEVLR
jgi:hypothetical protein